MEIVFSVISSKPNFFLLNELPAHWEDGISLDAIVEVFAYKEKNGEDICLLQSANEKKKSRCLQYNDAFKRENLALKIGHVL